MPDDESPGLPTWGELLREATARLGDASDARRLVERASGHDGADLQRALDERSTVRTEPFFRALLERRAAGEPLQYVVGRWGFRRLDLYVDRRVLIPRPETESVVEVALEELGRLHVERPVVVDLGTGSGAIALSFAVEVPGAEVWATDLSPDALDVARANVAGIGSAGRNVRMVEGSWFDALPTDLQGSVHLVISNPPYIGDAEDLPPEVADWEPASALRAGPRGVEDLEAIVDQAGAWLTRSGVLVMELAPHQAADVSEHARRAGASAVEIRPDLTDRDRMVVARW